MANKKLYRSNQNKVICGVCGGLGDYFNIDPVIIRLIWASLIFFQPWNSLLSQLVGSGVTGMCMIFYFLSAIFIPVRSDKSAY